MLSFQVDFPRALVPRTNTHLAVLVAAIFPISVSVQAQQKVTGPQASYWLQAETSTGFSPQSGGGAMGLGAVMGGLFGGGGAGGGASKTLKLDLFAPRDGNPATGQHAIPGAMAMGSSLKLLGSEKSLRPPEREERDVPEMQEAQGNMRMLFFWGCGEDAGAGQPVILDMKDMRDGKLPPNMRSTWVRDLERTPFSGRDRGFATWPNAQDSTRVPGNSSLTGDHAVSSNISPDIRFPVTATNDYLGAVNLSSAATPGGASKLSWNAVDRSLGYFATGMGVRETSPRNSDMVLWNSSTPRMLGGDSLMRFLPPSEVNRLVGERVVMPPSTTECVVPKQVLAAAGGQLLFSSLNAFGPELNVIYPPRPTDPRVEWKQEYSVKLRTRSHTTSMSMMAGGGRGMPSEDAASTQREKPTGSVPNPLGEAGNLLRGLFGR